MGKRQLVVHSDAFCMDLLNERGRLRVHRLIFLFDELALDVDRFTMTSRYKMNAMNSLTEALYYSKCAIARDPKYRKVSQ